MDYKKLCELIEVRNRQAELFKNLKASEFPEAIKKEADFLEHEMEVIIIKMAGEILENYCLRLIPLKDEEWKILKNSLCEPSTAESKFLDLKTVKHFVEKMKNDASQKADKSQVELMQASYNSGCLEFLNLLGIIEMSEQKKNNGIFVTWTIIDYCLTCLQELEGDEKNAKH